MAHADDDCVWTPCTLSDEGTPLFRILTGKDNGRKAIMILTDRVAAELIVVDAGYDLYRVRLHQLDDFLRERIKQDGIEGILVDAMPPCAIHDFLANSAARLLDAMIAGPPLVRWD